MVVFLLLKKLDLFYCFTGTYMVSYYIVSFISLLCNKSVVNEGVIRVHGNKEFIEE
jgi:hypothetical protein